MFLRNRGRLCLSGLLLNPTNLSPKLQFAPCSLFYSFCQSQHDSVNKEKDQHKEQIRLRVSAFLSWCFLFKLQRLKAQQIYTNCTNSVRKVLLNSLTNLNYFGEKQANGIAKDCAAELLSAYQIGKGVKIELFDNQSYRIRKQSRQGQIVYNPTTISMQILQNLNDTKSLILGNFGIGKSYSLLNFQYLSYHRFKYLYYNKTYMEQMHQLIATNFNFFYPLIPDSERERVKKVIFKQLKQIPLVIYYQVQSRESWRKFYKKLRCQFPYIADPLFEQKQKVKKLIYLTRAQKEIFYKELVTDVVQSIETISEKLKQNGFAINVIIDQANTFLKEIKLYEPIEDRMRLQQLKGQKKEYKDIQQQEAEQKRKVIKTIEEKIELLKSIGGDIKFYFSQLAEISIFEENPHMKKQFQKFKQHVDQGRQIQEFQYGIDLRTKLGQTQMQTIFVMLLSQKITQIVQERHAVLKSNIKEELAKEIQQLVGDSLQIYATECQSKYKSVFKTNTTYLAISNTIYQLRDQKIFHQLVDKLVKYEEVKTTTPAQNKNIQQSKVKETLNKFLQMCLSQLQKKCLILFSKRLDRKYGQSSVTDQKRIRVFYVQLNKLLQKLLQKESKKIQLPPQEKETDFQSTIDGRFKGSFRQCELQGRMEGDFQGEFNGQFKGQFQQMSEGKIKKIRKINQPIREITKGKLISGKLNGSFKGDFTGELYGRVYSSTGFKGSYVETKDVHLWNQESWKIEVSDVIQLLKPFRPKAHIDAILNKKELLVTDQELLQKLVYKPICQIKNQCIQVNISKNKLKQHIISFYVSTQYYMAVEEVSKKIQENLQNFYDKYMTQGLSELRGTLSVKIHEKTIEINLVNRKKNGFQHFKSKKITMKKSLEAVKDQIENLQNDQGIGLRPVTSEDVISINSKCIDTMIIYKDTDGNLGLVTFDYFCGKTTSKVKEKLKAHKTFYEQFLQNDEFFVKLFKGNYLHCISTLESVYNKIQNSQESYPCQNYQSIIRASDIVFQPKQLTMDSVNIAAAQRAIKSYKKDKKKVNV